MRPLNPRTVLLSDFSSGILALSLDFCLTESLAERPHEVYPYVRQALYHITNDLNPLTFAYVVSPCR